MRVALVLPQCSSPKQTYREYPLGLGLIATDLRRQGSDVAIFDQSAEGLDDEGLFLRLMEYGPDVVGFSILTPAYPAAQRQIRQLRRANPNAVLVAGGIHAGLFPEDLLADGADVAVVGDGCAAMTSLVADIQQGQRPSGVLRVKRNAAEDPGIIDRSVFDLRLYSHHSMLASLGCPYRCKFCCNFTGTLLQDGLTVRSADCVCREMRYLANEYGAQQVFFADDVFQLRRESVLKLCDRIREENLGLQWIAQMRADSVDLEVATAMASAGCKRIYFGVESGSNEMLRRAGKGTNLESVRLAVQSAKAAGLRVKTGWVFGLPGTLEEQYASVSFMSELRPHEISIHQLIPFPGTSYYHSPTEHGLRIRDAKDFTSFRYGGLSDNVSYDYLSRTELVELLEHTATVLEADGYVDSDRAGPGSEYLFSTPLSATSMAVFHSQN